MGQLTIVTLMALLIVIYPTTEKMLNEKSEFLLVADNAINTAPALIAGDPGVGFYNGQGTIAVDDTLGCIYRAGFRFKL